MSLELTQKLFNKGGQIVVSSRTIADDFSKRHADVIRAIEEYLTDAEVRSLNCLIESSYIDSKGETRKEYLITRDGFSLLIMGFKGKEALQWKLKYIEAFNKMEEIIKNSVPQISKRQELILNIVDSKNQFEMASAIKELEEYTHQIAHHEGAKSICDDSIITRPVVAKYIRECYGEELKELGVPLYDLILNREFSSFLETKGYIAPTRFPKKNGEGLEEKVHFQPLQPFLDYFVENSMAIVKDLNDGRGKIIFNYTKNIEEYITSKEFYDEFMKYIEKIYTNEEEEIISLL